MARWVYFSSVVAALWCGWALSACGDECSRAQDCRSSEVCYRGVCTPAVSSRFICSGDNDCNNNGAGPLRCSGGRCMLPGSGPIVIPDSGVTDTGEVPDTGAADVN